MNYYYNNMLVEVIKGDITDLKVDAIVNAANSSLLGGGGVDGAIHRKGGSQILEECIQIRNKQGGCSIGKAVITSAGNLPSKFVIHTVGPYWNGESVENRKLLAECYLSCLNLAIKNNIRTIAFPNISKGVYHFPKEIAVEIVIQTIKGFIDKEKIDKLIFVCFDDENFYLYRQKIKIINK
jgi:O-acetyl-ADP-ribose deacetylase